MSFLIRLLLSPALIGPVARLTAALLRPAFRQMGVVQSALAPVLAAAGASLNGVAYGGVVIEGWTEAEVAELVASVAETLAAVPAAFGFAIPASDVARLVTAVAGRLA